MEPHALSTLFVRERKNSPLASRASGCHGARETMAKPNYQFEKRRKELDKKAKKAEKLRLKAEAARTPADETSAEVSSQPEQG